jgi:hypothetical protein
VLSPYAIYGDREGEQRQRMAGYSRDGGDDISRLGAGSALDGEESGGFAE